MGLISYVSYWKGVFVILYFIAQSWTLSDQIYCQQQGETEAQVWGLVQSCSAYQSIPLSLMFPYFTDSDTFMEN